MPKLYESEEKPWRLFLTQFIVFWRGESFGHHDHVSSLVPANTMSSRVDTTGLSKVLPSVSFEKG